MVLIDAIPYPESPAVQHRILPDDIHPLHGVVDAVGNVVAGAGTRMNLNPAVARADPDQLE